jgi:hypothetical protein
MKLVPMQSGRLSNAALAAAAAFAMAVGAAGCSDDAEEPGGAARPAATTDAEAPTPAATAGVEASSPPSHPAAATVRELQEAFAGDDTARICAQMTRGAQRQAGQIAEGKPTTCERDVRRVFAIVAAGGGWGKGAPPTVTAVDGIGDQARATIADETGWTATATLAKEGGVWKLAGFLGRPAEEFEQIEASLRRSPSPELGPEQIEMVDRDGDPCPDVSDKNHPEVTGGCTFTAAATGVAIRLLTPFGDFELAECSVDYRVSVAPPGHGWIHDVEFGGGQRDRCTEIEPCLTDDGEHRPWQTRIVGDGEGGHLQRVVICLRTPLGSFARHHVIRLARESDGWRAEPTNQGDAGFKIDGPLTIAGDPFDIRKPDYLR